MKSRYALITVDTEALPKRAETDHVNRLMWGHFDDGTAGVAQMCEIGDEFNAKHVFFVDWCGSFHVKDQIADVIWWLDKNGQDVQLHTHPEYLPESFWREHDLKARPRMMNKYVGDERSELVIGYFADQIRAITKKPVLAHRAGSFRWNASTIRALANAGLKLSFNNSMLAMDNGQNGFSLPTNSPYAWSNGVIEVPVTEKLIMPGLHRPDWWTRLTFPESKYFRFNPWWGALTLNTFSSAPRLAVFLLHSWSLLEWDENGHAQYAGDKHMENYRKLLRRLTRDYDVITTPEFLDLYQAGKFGSVPDVDLSLAEYNPPGKKAKPIKNPARDKK